MNKSARVIVSSKGQVVIPKYIRNKLGLHSGSEVMINYKKNETFELLPIKKDIVSFFSKDDELQSKAAQNFLKDNANHKVFISSYVILEFVWVLKVKKFTSQEIYEAVINLVDNSGFIIGNQDIIKSAPEKYIKGKVHFADYMIVAEGETNSVTSFISFDEEIVQEIKTASYP